MIGNHDKCGENPDDIVADNASAFHECMGTPSDMASGIKYSGYIMSHIDFNFTEGM